MFRHATLNSPRNQTLSTTLLYLLILIQYYFLSLRLTLKLIGVFNSTRLVFIIYNLFFLEAIFWLVIEYVII